MNKIKISQDILKNYISDIKYKMIQTPEEVLKSKEGDCIEQTELARYLLTKEGVECSSYFMEHNRGEASFESWKHFGVHNFIVFENENKFYWFEHASCGGRFTGVHEYESLKELLADIKQKYTSFFKHYYKLELDKVIFHKYEPVKFPISYKAYILHCMSSPIIELDD